MKLDLIYKIAGLRVQRKRKDLNWSQEELADRLNLLRTSVTNIEAGRQRPPLHVWYLMAEIFNCEITDLLPLRMREADWELDVESREETAERLLENLAILVEANRSDPSSANSAQLENAARRALLFSKGEMQKPS